MRLGLGCEVGVVVGVMGWRQLGWDVGVVVGVMGRRHRLVTGSRSPRRTMCCWYQMQHVVSLKVAVHPALHKVLTDMRDAWARPGMTCARVAACGRPGMSRLQVWLEVSFEPSGRVTVIGLLAITLLMTCVWGIMKWPVAPVSARAYWGVWDGV